MLTDEEREHLEQLENDKREFEDIVPLHLMIFGKTMARFGMLEDHEYSHDYVLFLLDHEGMRWLIDKYYENQDDERLGFILDTLNAEYEAYNEWGENNRYMRKLKEKMQ
jgi:hypothetical protein